MHSVGTRGGGSSMLPICAAVSTKQIIRAINRHFHSCTYAGSAGRLRMQQQQLLLLLHHSTLAAGANGVHRE